MNIDQQDLLELAARARANPQSKAAQDEYQRAFQHCSDNPPRSERLQARIDAIDPAALDAPDNLLDDAYDAALQVEAIAARGISWTEARQFV